MSRYRKSIEPGNRNPNIESKIEIGDFETPIARVNINGRGFGFSVRMLNEKEREWLQGVLTRQFEDVFQLGYDRAMEDVKKARKEYLDLVS